jgi:hypothetical protein
MKSLSGRMSGVLLALLLLCGCAAPSGYGDSGHRLNGALGALWTHDLQAPRTTATQAAVDPWAFAWQLGYDYVPPDQDGAIDWGFCLDLSGAVGDVDSSRTGAGWFVSEEGGTMSWLRFTPGVTARVPLGPASANESCLTASAGLGYYGLEIEADQYSPLFPVYGTRTILEDDCLGAFVGIGYESLAPGVGGFFVEAEAHFVDFEPSSEYPAHSGSIRGPMIALWTGFVVSF